MPRPFQNTIYRPLLLAILIIAAAPSAFSVFWSYFGSREILNKEIKEQLQDTVTGYTDFYNQTIEGLERSCGQEFDDPELRRMLEILRDAPNTRIFPGDIAILSQRLQEQLNQLPRHYSDRLAHVSAVYLRGQAQALVHWGDGPEELADRLFQQCQSLTQSGLRWDLTDRYDEATSQPLIIFLKGLDGPTLHSSQLFQFVVFQPEELLRLLADGRLPDNRSISVFSERGYALSHAGTYRLSFDEAQEMALFNSSKLTDVKTIETASGANRTVAGHVLTALRVRRTPTTAPEGGQALDADWMFCLSRDTSETFSYLGWLYWRAWLVGGLLILVTGLLGFLLARRIVQPLVQLTSVAERIAQGHFHIRVPVRTNNEFGRLARAFNEMAEHLETSYQNLRRSLDALKKHSDQLLLLQEIANAVNTQLSPERILDVIMRELKKLIQYDHASVAFLDPGEQQLTVHHTVPEIDEALFKPGAKIPLKGTNRGWVIQHREPLIKENLLEAEQHGVEDETLAKLGIRSLIILPLISTGGIFGVFGIGSKTPHAYDAGARDILMRMANMLAVALDHSRLFERVKAFADELEQKAKARTRELERAQAKLVQTEKMAATGRLAGSLAHEINNPLGIINNYLNIAIQQAQSTDSKNRASDLSMEHLLIIQDEISRIARIVKGLMGFYRPSHGQRQPTDLQEIMSQILALLKHDWDKRKIKVETNFLNNLPMTSLSPDLMRQVFMNILRNAEDAIDEDGQVEVAFTIGAENRDGEPREVIRVSITDSGCGIPEQAMIRIFDPFFTTKKDEKGTGLGLSVTFSILQLLDGAIELKSRVADKERQFHGTTVILTIPIVEHQDSSPPPTQESLLLG